MRTSCFGKATEAESKVAEGGCQEQYPTVVSKGKNEPNAENVMGFERNFTIFFVSFEEVYV